MKARYILLALLFFCLNIQAQIATITGKVVAVADGDTFTLLVNGNRQQKIRLQGIDCPEFKQDFGSQAKQFTSSFFFAKKVRVEVVGQDRYNRTLGVVLRSGTVVKTQLRICPCCQEGALVTIEILPKRGPPRVDLRVARVVPVSPR